MASLSDRNSSIRAAAVRDLATLDADRPVQPVLDELAKAGSRFAHQPLDAPMILETGLRRVEAEAMLIGALRASDARLREMAASALA